jgi:Tol biopolymer transport system component
MKVRDLWILPMDGEKKPFPYLATAASETEGRFSPDVCCVVYGSDETGRPEIFVQDFPAKGAKFQVSAAGGTEPRWSRGSRELSISPPTDV